MYRLKVPYDSEKPDDVAQLDCLKRAISKQRFGVFFQQRVGKTRVAIDFIGHSISKGAKKVLVLCPLCAQAGWKAQVSEYLGNTGTQVHMGIVQKTNEELPKIDSEEALIIVCTYKKATLMRSLFLRWKPDVVIFDEAHLLKNRTSKQSKVCAMIGRTASGVLGLTGTPYSNRKFSDLFGIFRAVSPTLFGTRWADFQRQHCKMGGYMGYEVVGYVDEPEMLRIVDENSMRVMRKDVMREPDAEDIIVRVEFTPAESKLYKAMEKDAIIFLEDQPVVTADMVTTQRLKLQQITSGSVKDDEGERLRVTNSKLEYAEDLVNTLLEGDSSRLIICCRYVADIDNLAEVLGSKALCITGASTETARNNILQWWRTGKDYPVLIVQEQTMSMGVDLSMAHHMIFYSWGEDSITHSQVRDRILGRGQTAEVVQYHYMVVNDSIDGLMYKSLKANISFAEKAANWKKWVSTSGSKES